MIHCFGTADEKLNVNAGIAALGHPIRTAARALSQPRSGTASSRKTHQM
jgi:acetyl-CoA acetyltransferase